VGGAKEDVKPGARQGSTGSAAARTLPLFPDDPHKCRAAGCDAFKQPEFPLCWKHFSALPEELHPEYWRLRGAGGAPFDAFVAKIIGLAEGRQAPSVEPCRAPDDLSTPEPQQALAPRLPKIVLPPRRLQTYDPVAHGALCDQCPAKGRTVVPPTPAWDNDMITMPTGVIVGMEPGWEDQRQGKPFVGMSGKKLDNVLKKNGLNRDGFHITNAALCMAEKEEHRAAVFKCCKPRLEKELASLPKQTPVITLGSPAFRSAFGRKVAITQARGFVWTHKDGRKFLPTVHPSFVLRDAVQAPLWNLDWRRIAKHINGTLVVLEPKKWIVPRTTTELMKALALFKNDKWLAVDIETTKATATTCQLLCVGISNGKHTVVVPWEPVFKNQLNQLLSKKIVVGHNFIAFDSIVLKRYGIVCGAIEDTIIAHHAYASHFRQAMDHVASVYLDVIPWKILHGIRGSDEKGQPKAALSEDDLHMYNAYDCFYQAHMWMAMHKDVQANRELYEHDKQCAFAAREMTLNGVYVDEKRRAEIAKALHEKIDRLYSEMKSLAGWDFGPTKTAHIRKILFEEFGAPVLERTAKKGEPSTGKRTLQAFAVKHDQQYGKFAAALVKWRMCRKVLATHVEGLPIEEDGRVHASWKSFATPTGRVGVRGPNLNNMKREDKRFAGEPEYRVRELYTPSPGNMFVGFDFAQIEPHMSAYLSGDPEFIAAVATGDIHTAIARIIFGENEPRLRDSHTAKTEGKYFRQISKSVGLAVSYLAGEETLFNTLQADGFQIKFSHVVTMLSLLKRKFKGYFDYVDQNHAACRKTGYVVAGFASGRKRWLGHAPEPQKVGNTPCQGGAADVMNYRMIELRRHFREKYGTAVKMVAQVYDSIIFECPKKLVGAVEEGIKRILAKPWMINGRSVVLPFELKSGYRWSEV
jgi:uracil-DNA glycosylase family 4